MSFKINKRAVTEKNLNLSVHQAESKDIEALVEISRKSFPKLLRWQIPRFLSRKRWRQILSSEAAETWVCLANGQLAGYVTLVRDITAFRLEKHQYNRFILRKLYYYLFCPRLFLQMLVRKILMFISRSIKPDSVIQNGPEPINCTWIHSIAVDPEMRRNGVATRLLQLCEERTLQLNKVGMKLAVDLDNIVAQNLYENFGFYCTHCGYERKIYTIKVANGIL